MSDNSPVWFITGCSTGFGRELAKLVLDRGWRVVVTARDIDRVRELTDGHKESALALALDVTDAGQVAASVKAAEDRFGAIDVLVNNAGYGYQAPVEEGDDAEIRAMFEANVFGLAAMIRAALPGMRARRRGHIVNISSVAGFVGFPGSGYYAATKHAVEGFRTRWLGKSNRSASRSCASSPVPSNRLGRPIPEADAKPDRRLCRDSRVAHEGDLRHQRQAARRSGTRRRCDDQGRGGGKRAAPPGTRRLRRRCRAR